MNLRLALHYTLSPLQQIYNIFFRRNSIYVPTIFLGAFGFSIGFDVITSSWWDEHNKGVSVGGIQKNRLGGQL